MWIPPTLSKIDKLTEMWIPLRRSNWQTHNQTPAELQLQLRRFSLYFIWPTTDYHSPYMTYNRFSHYIIWPTKDPPPPPSYMTFDWQISPLHYMVCDWQISPPTLHGLWLTDFPPYITWPATESFPLHDMTCDWPWRSYSWQSRQPPSVRCLWSGLSFFEWQGLQKFLIKTNCFLQVKWPPPRYSTCHKNHTV